MESKFKLLEYIIKLISYLGFSRNYYKCEINLANYIWILVGLVNYINSTGHLLYIIFSSTNTFNDTIYDLLTSSSFGASLFLNIHYLLWKQQIITVIYHIGDYTYYTKPLGVKELDRKFTKLVKVYMYITNILAMVFYIKSLKYHSAIKECGNISKCGFPINMIVEFEIFRTRPTKEIIYTIQYLSSLNMMHISFLIMLIYSLIYDHLTHRIILLQRMIRKIKSMSKATRRQHFKVCVKHHQQILDIYYALKNITNLPFSMAMLNVPTYINLTIFSLLMVPYQPIVIIIIVATIVITCLSSSCEHIIEQSTKLASEILYSIPWDGDIRFQKDMMLFAARCNIPLAVTASKFGEISRPFVVAVLRQAYSISAVFFIFFEDKSV